MKFKQILEIINQKQEFHSESPFYQFLRNTSVSPQERLAFAPCFAFFVMNFSELNRHVLREEPTTNPIQLIINDHTYEDEDHWIWFLEDIHKLGYDINTSFTETMRFLWSDETMVQRKVVQWMLQTAAMAKPIHRLVLVESIEAIADVFLSTTRSVSEELQALNQINCRYFGELHFGSDTGHTMHSETMTDFLENIVLTTEESEEAIQIVQQAFDIFSDLVSDLLAHAKVPKVVNGNFLYTYEMRSKQVHKVKPLGSYLVESGLLTAENLEFALTEQRVTGKRLGDVISDNGWVRQQTIEYIVEKLVMPERNTLFLSNVSEEVPKTLVAV